MQSSGASLVTYFLGQMPSSFVIVDMHHRYRLHHLGEVEGKADPVIAKCTLAIDYDLEHHSAAFRPDRTILVLRHPFHNYVALSRKVYRGDIEAKFRKLERYVVEQDQFDLVLLFEDFALRQGHVITELNKIGINVKPGFFTFPRSRKEIRTFNMTHSSWAKEEYLNKWSFGNVQGGRIRPEYLFKHVPRSVKKRVRELCPETTAMCDAHYRAQVSSVQEWWTAVWWDQLIRPAKKHFVRPAKQQLRGAQKWFFNTIQQSEH
jgi:hypothetical protein